MGSLVGKRRRAGGDRCPGGRGGGGRFDVALLVGVGSIRNPGRDGNTVDRRPPRPVGARRDDDPSNPHPSPARACEDESTARNELSNRNNDRGSSATDPCPIPGARRETHRLDPERVRLTGISSILPSRGVTRGSGSFIRATCIPTSACSSAVRRSCARRSAAVCRDSTSWLARIGTCSRRSTA